MARMTGLLYGLLVTAFLGLNGCDSGNQGQPKPPESKEPTSTSPTQAFSQRPASIQPRTQPLVVALAQPIIDAAQVGGDASAYLSLEPNTQGKAEFDSPNSMKFTPDAPLASGQEYKLKVKLEGLLNQPAKSEPVYLPFKTAPMEMEVATQAMQPVPDSPEQMTLGGKISTSDYAEPKALESTLKANNQGRMLPIEWQHDEAGKEHSFVISGIQRLNYQTQLTLTWNGQPIQAQGSKAQGSQGFTVPRQSSFSITRVESRNEDSEGQPHIVIFFSDALDSQQDLTGLVQLAGEDADTQIMGYQLLVYPTSQLEPGEYELTLHAGIKPASSELTALAEDQTQVIAFDPPKPALRFVGKGSIMPDAKVMEVPFEARSLSAVQITAMEVFPDKIEQFLQVNALNGDYELERVGRYMWRKTIPLNAEDTEHWQRYSIDLAPLFKAKQGTMYRLELSADRRFSTFPCPEGTPEPKVKERPIRNFEDLNSSQPSGWDGIEDYVQEEGFGFNYYEWEKRDDACSDSYFLNNDQVKTAHNFVASNIGLIAKQDGQGKIHVIASDLRSAKALEGANLSLRNYQGQQLASGSTDSQGFAELSTSATPFLLVAQHGADLAYLKLSQNTALETSQFDVGGEALQKGLKGSMYGERGVWRPGDDIHLTFVVQDRNQTLPANHPVTMQLFDPKGKLRQTLVNKEPLGPFYTFTLKTEADDPTGDWLAKATLGGSTFDRVLKIETVRPNRLKLELDFGSELLRGYQALPEGKLFAQWLHGGSASELQADVSVRLREKTTSFTRFPDYAFDDPTRKLDSQDQQLVDAPLDDKGYLRFNSSFQPEQPAPGMLSAVFTSRVHETTGGFSISKQAIDYHMFQHYVGIHLPKGDQERGMLLTDIDHDIDIASLDADGKPVSLPQVEVSLYKVDWKWWWDKSPDSLAEYADASHSSKLQQDIISTKDGKGTWKLNVAYPEWGRYLVRACDLVGQHCTGKTVYIDWPGWAGRAQEESSGAAAMLRFSSDKPSYQVGDTAILQLPEAEAGRALLTVETSSQILDQRWIEFNGQRTQVELPITAEMSPNAYVSISLLQGHQGKKNDRPIRLYGLLPLLVEDPATILNPVINAATEWKPDSQQSISISEQSGRAMDYTLAVVDEGLLGLTRFTTPDLHKTFYRKEALGIKSWDLYDSVIGAYSGNLERVLAIGGGDEGVVDDAANKPKRFPPVVRFLGSFHLEPGQTREHSVDIPSYLGAVRIMAVAASGTAYGKAEQSVFVRQPLMLLSSLPRTLKVGEEIQVPLTLFVADESVKSVELKMEPDGAFSTQTSTINVPIKKAGETLVSLPLKAGNKPLFGKISFSASSGQLKSGHEVNLEVQVPNLPSLQSLSHKLEAKGEWQQKLTPLGIPGTNLATLELSSTPSLNLEGHLDYLVRYPHGCLEQTVSAAFPQLYLPKLLKLSPDRQEKVELHMKRAINKLVGFQSANGNLMYWPGSINANDWASLYAGHFLIEAQKAGYKVPASLLSSWLSYQTKLAQNWVQMSGEDSTSTQAYRLYVLARARSPQMGAMNRLRESGKANDQARWLLSAAYLLAGQPDAARKTTKGLDPEQLDVPTSALTFSNKLGQLGLQLETMIALKRNADADKLVLQIADELATNDGKHNTHDLSWALVSVAHYLGNSEKPVHARFALDSADAIELTSAQPLLSQLLTKADNAFELSLHNDGDQPLYASVSQQGIPAAGSEQAEAEGLAISAELLDRDGNSLWQSEAGNAEPLSLIQGQDYELVINLTNNTASAIQNIALSTLLPSGAEIGSQTPPPAPAKPQNADGEEYPMQSEPEQQAGKVTPLAFQDVRDDRVLSYFDLAAGATRTVNVKFNAAYLGQYIFPAIRGEAMYQPTTRASTAGMAVKIVSKKE